APASSRRNGGMPEHNTGASPVINPSTLERASQKKGTALRQRTGAPPREAGEGDHATHGGGASILCPLWLASLTTSPASGGGTAPSEIRTNPLNHFSA